MEPLVNSKYIMWNLVNVSAWPVMVGVVTFMMMVSAVMWFKESESKWFISCVFNVFFLSMLWWQDVTREATFTGWHNKYVQASLKLGMMLFIFSEVMFFMGFFWMFFHSALSPLTDAGAMWPPFSIVPLNPMSVPLLNTIILLSSGVTITWSHHSLINDDDSSVPSLSLTLTLGLYFTLIQLMEYKESLFSISDSVFGSIFFVATGFHGLHVIIGSLFLTVCLIRLLLNHFSPAHHTGYELAIWYWHFVDVVWLFLFSTIYFWGYSFNVV